MTMHLDAGVPQIEGFEGFSLGVPPHAYRANALARLGRYEDEVAAAKLIPPFVLQRDATWW